MSQNLRILALSLIMAFAGHSAIFCQEIVDPFFFKTLENNARANAAAKQAQAIRIMIKQKERAKRLKERQLQYGKQYRAEVISISGEQLKIKLNESNRAYNIRLHGAAANNDKDQRLQNRAKAETALKLLVNYKDRDKKDVYVTLSVVRLKGSHYFARLKYNDIDIASSLVRAKILEFQPEHFETVRSLWEQWQADLEEWRIRLDSVIEKTSRLEDGSQEKKYWEDMITLSRAEFRRAEEEMKKYKEVVSQSNDYESQLKETH